MHIQNIVVAGYERVVRAEDAACGFVGFIAVHDTSLGPALGGLRMWPYANEADALTDVLRLAAAMTWKAAAAGLPLGGGKAVIVADARNGKTRERLASMGRVVELLGGSYITAEDVGINAEDLKIVRAHTRHVTGLAREEGGSGDPSPFTALGVFESIKVCLKQAHGDDAIGGRTFAVQGLGSVGSQLARLLVGAGGKVIGADVNAERAAAVAKELGIALCAPEKVLFERCDVLAPCALGAVLDKASIPKLKAPIVAGAANNQLAERGDGARLQDRGILYAPDFVANAGGLINISVEVEPEGYREDEAVRRVKGIADTLRQVFARARAAALTPEQAALALAEERIGQVRAANPA
jgi:leucine dehydrogenase